MRKPDLEIERFFWNKRTKKEFLRRGMKKKYANPFSIQDKELNFKIKHDEIVISKKNLVFHDFLLANNFIDNSSDSLTFKIPEHFCLKTNYAKSIDLIRRAVYIFNKYPGKELVFDFSICKTAETLALFILKVIQLEYIDHYRKLERGLKILKVTPTVRIIKSDNNKVNIQLLLMQFLDSAQGKGIDLEPISATGIYKGSRTQKHYLENKKGIAATMSVQYINECLKRHEYELNVSGVNNLEGIISEALNNAEDHSPMTEWYLTASFLEEINKGSGNFVGELNLSFLNFGYSIYQGFEDTKMKNADVYKKMEDLYFHVTDNYKHHKFSKESLFTLYALQDGFSRLKFESESRGTGTMKFLTSFWGIGDYEDKSRGFLPHLQILSGNTRITCDSEYQPFEKEKLLFISLNKEQDLTMPPAKSHLEDLPSYFPGTALGVKIYINKEHLNKKIKDGRS